MANDPELKAMSDVFDALQRLDENTRQRVVDWVLAKLQSPSLSSNSGSKRGPKPGSKRRRRRGRKPQATSNEAIPGKRGPKPGSKRKRRPGRPKGSKNRGGNQSIPSTGKRRGRPLKVNVQNLS